MSPIHSATAVTPVTQLSIQRRRRHLERLLDTRASLATMVSEKRSHRLEDAEYLAGIQNSVEVAVMEQFPDVYQQKIGDWAVQAIAAEHPVGMLTPDCSICQAIAAERRINLVAPDAA